ncbi:MAG: aldehyde ferredoxin oxidoreductase family protein [Chloroflexi bacterium]|nr:aldehyde ferredoxin oxidoreductase family protein [Chloroflexota bacterium]
MQSVLTVNLSTKKFDEYQIPPDWKKDYLGGASLAARMLYQDLVPELDPLSPEAPLLFLNGPLSGTSGPAVGRFVVCALSPATGLWGESNCGGFWGPELRKAGYDGILISGKSDEPVLLLVHDDHIELQSASHLWGLDPYATIENVESDLGLGRVRVATIGPAGEARVPMGVIMCDHGRVAGRTGMGAVMGSKNLKAIAVKGSGTVPVSNKDSYDLIRSKANRVLRQDNMTRVLQELGTASGGDYFNYLGSMPKKGFSAGQMEGADLVSGSTMAETILVGVSTCHACVIACGRVVQIENGKKQKGPEYETLVGFGPNLWLNDAAFVTRMNDLCDRYGFDTISISNTISLAFALFENGTITKQDTDGLDLIWGDAEVVEMLVHLAGSRDGFGEYLALGARALGRRFGAEDEAVQVNGLEVPYHDPRGVSGMALVYATSPRGACHNQSDYFLADIGQVEEDLGLNFFDRHAGAEKAANVAKHQDWRTVFNSLVICFFSNVPPQTVVDLINSATDNNFSIADIMESGERGWNLKRAINNRLGLNRTNDKLPKPLLQPLQDGGAAGFVPDIVAMLDAYYTARGWDPENGFPSKEKLISLGMGWVAADLWPEN